MKWLDLHKSHLELNAVWDNEVDQEILMKIIKVFGDNKDLKTKLEKKPSGWKAATTHIAPTRIAIHKEKVYKDKMIDKIIETLVGMSTKLTTMNEADKMKLIRLEKENKQLQAQIAGTKKPGVAENARVGTTKPAGTTEQELEEAKNNEAKINENGSENGDVVLYKSTALFANLHSRNRTEWKL